MALLPDTAVEPGPPEVISNAVGAEVRQTSVADGVRLEAETPWGYISQTLSAGDRARIVEGTRACEERLEGARLVLCGTRPRPARVNPRVLRSEGNVTLLHYVAAISATPDDVAAQRLAAKLLDTGSVDAVLIARVSTDDVLATTSRLMPGLSASSTRGLLILPEVQRSKTAPSEIAPGWAAARGDFDALAESLGDVAPADVRTVWPQAWGDLTALQVRRAALKRQRPDVELVRTTYAALSRLDRGCDGRKERAGAQCDDAINQLCRARAVDASAGFGPVASAGDAATVVCVHAMTLAEPGFAKLASHHSGCDGKRQRSGTVCSLAIHGYCVSRGRVGGFGPLSDSPDPLVACVGSDIASRSVSARFGDACPSPDQLLGARCRAAIHQRCVDSGNLTGFGPAEVDANGFGVICIGQPQD